METAAANTLGLRTNLADSPVTMAMKDGRVTSPIVSLNFCGPKLAHDGFKAMLRENAFDAGELAIVTYLQARAYGKPFVLLPTPVSGRFQHHCIGFNIEHGELEPKESCRSACIGCCVDPAAGFGSESQGLGDGD